MWQSLAQGADDRQAAHAAVKNPNAALVCQLTHRRPSRSSGQRPAAQPLRADLSQCVSSCRTNLRGLYFRGVTRRRGRGETALSLAGHRVTGWTSRHRQGLGPPALAVRIGPEKLQEGLRFVLQFSIVANDARKGFVALFEVSLGDVAAHDKRGLEHRTCQQYK